MFSLFKNRSNVIGVDLGNQSLKLAQLAETDQGVVLVGGCRVDRPDDIRPGSADWQRWAIDAIRAASGNGQFRGKDVIAAIPAPDVFVDHVRVPRNNAGKMEEAVFAKIKPKLPFEPSAQNTMMKFIPVDQDNVLAMATERCVINRHLAIYEKAGLTLRSIGVWPMALANCYARFFGRRRSDLEAVVMLLDIQSDCTNLVISLHKNPLFASSIPIGSAQLSHESSVNRLGMELISCRRRFLSVQRNAHIERLVFLSGLAVDTDVYRTIAKQLEMQAQMGDCLAAVDVTDPEKCGIDRRNGRTSWATVFGLSLS